MKNQTINFYKPFKIANSYGINYFNHCIPKNAMYGRINKHTYIYINDYKQFTMNMHNINSIRVHILDTYKQDYFITMTIYKNNPLFKMCYNFVAKNNLWNVKCENVLCMHRARVIPTLRKPQKYNQNTGRDRSRTIGINDDIKFKECTVYAHYSYMPASMVGCSIR